MPTFADSLITGLRWVCRAIHALPSSTNPNPPFFLNGEPVVTINPGLVDKTTDNDCRVKLQKRTLTILYNTHPTRIADAYRALD